MEMNYNMTDTMKSFAHGTLEGMGMNRGVGCFKHQHNIVHPRPPVISEAANPKRKKRANAKVPRTPVQKLPKTQDLGPPRLLGYGETIVVSNPFDDAPTKTYQTMSTNLTANMIAQQISTQRMNGPPTRTVGPMGLHVNGLGPRMPSNMGQVRPMVNHMTKAGFAPMNQVRKNLTCPNNMAQQRPNGPMTIQHQEQMDQMKNIQISKIINELKQTSANYLPVNNIPMSTNVKTQLNHRPIDAPCLFMNNANNAQTQNIKKLNDVDFGNEVITVEQLMNIDLNIPQLDEMRELLHSMSPENNKNDTPVCGNVRPNKAVQQPNLQRAATNMALKQRAGGKIYPGNQPVIFNSQNPNAPPIYPCGVCHKEVSDNDQGIICESGCNFWFHRNCLGLSEAAFQLLTQEIYAEWVCDNCLRTKNIPLVKYKS